MKLVYTHEKTNGEVFYVGIGESYRPYKKSGRSKFWKETIKKYPDYKVNIVCTNLTWEEACEIEIYLIKYYGRRNLGTGTLVNLTDGGDGGNGFIMTEEQKENLRQKNLGRTYPNRKRPSLEAREHLSNLNKGSGNPKSKIVLDLNTGIFYDCLREASEAYNIHKTTMSQKIKQNKIHLIYV